MGRPSYRAGVAFIALNDEPMDNNLESIACYVTVVMLSEMTGVPTDKIARAVLRVRKANGYGEGY